MLRNDQGPLVRLYLDFDGTLTRLSGSEVVYSPEYKSLQTNPSYDYYYTDFHDDIADRIKAQLPANKNEESGCKFLMAEGALDFLKHFLKLDKTEVVIISLNREKFIKGMIKAHDPMLAEQFEKAVIYDVNRLTVSKGPTVSQHEKNHGTAAVTVFCDDSPNDFKAMTDSMAELLQQEKLSSSKSNVVLSYHENKGTFNFPQITAQIHAAMPVSSSQYENKLFDQSKAPTINEEELVIGKKLSS
jgi:hypothetical protein